jgi:pyrimidine deaminase RibD-like protein
LALSNGTIPEASPDWCLDRSERESIRISVKSNALLPIEPGDYYLPPAWREGTRLFYLVDPDDNNPLFPIRFKPRWDYWDRAVQNVLFWLPGGVTYAHLERAVELAANSVSDDDEKPCPKVGALIVKDGEVLATGFRNEYGKSANMHAEETALHKCNKLDLTGAIAITTLEPCVTGRRYSKTTCAHLLLQAGIKHVIIGMLDPDSRIRGTAEGIFRRNDVSVYYFLTELRPHLQGLTASLSKIKKRHVPDYLSLLPRGAGNVTLEICNYTFN